MNITIEGILYFLLLITVLVFVHELGHFAAARFFGMRVDVFSIGMGPRAFGFKRGDTDYRVAYFPIGGYVKIAGMVDESMDNDFVNSEPQPWEYRSKPRWQRSIVISAGVIMNLIAAGIIFSILIYKNGDTLIPFDSQKPITVAENSVLYDLGMRSGDLLLKLNDQPIKYYNDFENIEELTHSNLSFTIIRNGETKTLVAPNNFLSEMGNKQLGLDYLSEPIIGMVMPGSPADKAGLLSGDKIISINEIPITYFEDIPALLQKTTAPTVNLVIQRNNTTENIIVGLDQNKMGIRAGTQQFVRVDYSIFDATTLGFASIYTNMKGMINGFAKIFQGKEEFSKSVGGPLAIMDIAGKSAAVSFDTYLKLMAFISLSLAFMNILPIPALDGGHLIILIIESIFRRDLPYKWKINIQQIGFTILIGFMIFVVFNDVMKFF